MHRIPYKYEGDEDKTMPISVSLTFTCAFGSYKNVELFRPKVFPLYTLKENKNDCNRSTAMVPTTRSPFEDDTYKR